MLDRRSLLRTSGMAAAGALGVVASASVAEASSAPSHGRHPFVHDPTDGVTRTLLQENPSPAKGWKTVQTLVEIPRRRESGRHSHPGVEVGYIVRGDVVMEFDDGTSLRLRTGDPFFIPSDTIHNARNVGKVTTMMLSTYVVDETKPLVTTHGH
ncbi:MULTISPECIES: cupin domain-containing protein [unclassified Streptomyces]|uniref:cupin domain-containing protein n=1 Tax=unclassified Streptomyces TaxID=2593676 RepID=UPI0013703689|nr:MULTISPECIES: cupin domain-containing protein [unclassified Streptomyces]NEA00426.1 cupin domain-containing protein [Streptomyces sp. SID10116]MYY84403.1 cupin domain-containing protein [Streptomyces sp. SID335]MYZ15337.1 cupin domain-containing protein [Streptomyces sp. SID337]NDZ89408.1 cupin domain-containing protein [Streptomyces sp. SID10115]NDZ90219.1 cupin domain-containing protein [Streptomyces sp. SID10115]